MTVQTNGKALQIAKTYVEAIANRDIEKIMSVAADGIICKSPIGQTQGAERFRQFHDGFAKMIKKLTVIAALGNDKEAVVVYNAETHPVPSAITAEHLVIQNDKIASTEVIYDATPFAAYMATVKPH